MSLEKFNFDKLQKKKRRIVIQRPRIYNCFCVNNYVARKYSVVQGSHSEPGLLVHCGFAHICEQLFKGNFQAILLYRCKLSLRRTERKAFNQRLNLRYQEIYVATFWIFCNFLVTFWRSSNQLSCVSRAQSGQSYPQAEAQNPDVLLSLRFYRPGYFQNYFDAN